METFELSRGGTHFTHEVLKVLDEFYNHKQLIFKANGLVGWRPECMSITAIDDLTIYNDHAWDYGHPGEDWIEGPTTSANAVTISKGDTILCKSSYHCTEDNYLQFHCTGRFSVGGNIMSMSDTGEIYEACFYNMFKDCTTLVSAPALPATTLASLCYAHMFQGCTSLASAPDLPATTLGYSCYLSMFRGCTALTVPANVAATVMREACFAEMYMNCTSLVVTPDLPSTELSPYAYCSMFEGCTSLTTAPVLPATDLAEGCYSKMFKGCTALQIPPVLPEVTSSSCYFEMFMGSGIIVAPELLAEVTALDAYTRIFKNCAAISSAVIVASFLATDTSDCFVGCAATGTLYTSDPDSWQGHVPDGWDIVEL